MFIWYELHTLSYVMNIYNSIMNLRIPMDGIVAA
jgi:hypothetical protein